MRPRPQVVFQPRDSSGPAEVSLGSELCTRVARNLLLGDAGSIGRHLEASVLGIDTGREYVAFRARARRRRRWAELAAELGLAETCETRRPRIGLAAELDGDLIGFLSARPTSVTSGVVGIGPAAPPDRLVGSFQLASRAMQAALAFGLTSVHAFDDLGLLPAIVADVDVGETVWRRYLQPFSGDESGRETVAALGTYFACGMHVDRAAAKLTLHPNTLRNRLARFTELTGADWRDTSVAMQVWWALQVCRSEQVRGPGGRPFTGRDRPLVPLGELGAARYTAQTRRHAADLEPAEFVRGLLWGTLSATELDYFAAVHRIDPECDYFAVRARPAPGRTVRELARAHGLGDDRSAGSGHAAVVDGDLVGLVTVRPRGSMPGVSGLGPGRPLRLLHESFRMASRALQVADLRGMTGVCEFDQLGLLPAILADEAVGTTLCRRYVTPLGNTEFAAEIVETLRAYLVHGMHVPRTAAALCVHPNTVRYRIAKFEELTGVAFRDDRTVAFEVFWALEHRSRPADGESVRDRPASALSRPPSCRTEQVRLRACRPE